MLTPLSNSALPLIAPAAGFLKSKAVLAAGYVLVAVLITLGGWGVTVYLQKLRTEAKLAKTTTALVVTQSNVQTLEGVKEQQVKTIGTLTEMRENDEDKLDKLIHDKAVLAKKSAELKKKVAELESSDETVRKYLSQPIPDGLACVHNGTCPAPEAGPSAGDGPASPTEEPTDPLF